MGDAPPGAIPGGAAPAIDRQDSNFVPDSVDGVWSIDLTLLPPEDAEKHLQSKVKGDKILLPHSALQSFMDALKRAQGTSRLPNPLMVKLSTTPTISAPISRLCGIAGWEAEEGTVIAPRWILDEMTSPEAAGVAAGAMPLAGDQLRVSSVDVPRASSITLQPLSRDIRKLSEEDQVRLLQTGVQDVYTTLTVGDHLTIEGEGGGVFKVTACETGDGEATPTVCMVDAKNDVLIVDVKVEESQEFEKARTAFDAAKLAYRTALEQRAVAAGAVVAAAAGRGGAAFDGGPPSDDAALLKLLEALVVAGDAAEALDVKFGDELVLARSGLEASRRAVELAEEAAKKRREAELAADAHVAEAAARAIEAVKKAEEAKVAAVALQARFLGQVPAAPPEDAPAAETVLVRVRLGVGGGGKGGGVIQRRFSSTDKVDDVRAWVGSEYPVDATAPLSPDFRLQTQPLLGAPGILLGDLNATAVRPRCTARRLSWSTSSLPSTCSDRGAMRGAMRVSRGDEGSSVDLRLVLGSVAVGRRWCMLAGRVKDRHGLMESYT